MKKILILLVILGLIIGGLALFYSKKTEKVEAPQVESERKVLYWTCAMHPSVKSDKPGNCPICNMTLIPVYKEAESPEFQPTRSEKVAVSEEQQAVTSEEKQEGTYYGCGVKEEGHCPHCDEGKEDAECICGQHSFMIKGQQINCPICGKKLVKLEPEEVKVKEENIISRVSLKGTQAELAGVKTEPVGKHHLTKQIRTVGKIAFDPQLAVSQEEFLTALETRQKVSESPDPDVINRADDLVEKSKFKLRLSGMSDNEIIELEKQGTAQLNLVLPENKAWVYADVYEYELSWVKIGQDVKITTTAYPGEEFIGIIKSISPVLDPQTRSAKVRIETDNINQKLKPEMFVDVIIESMYMAEDGAHEVLAIPKEAVLDTGTRKIVYVDSGGGKFLGKQIKTGPEATAEIDGQKQKMYPVLNGLSEGEIIVTKGNFLVDSQSQLTGAAAAAYGGAIGKEEEQKMPPSHQH